MAVSRRIAQLALDNPQALAEEVRRSPRAQFAQFQWQGKRMAPSPEAGSARLGGISFPSAPEAKPGFLQQYLQSRLGGMAEGALDAGISHVLGSVLGSDEPVWDEVLSGASGNPYETTSLEGVTLGQGQGAGGAEGIVEDPRTSLSSSEKDLLDFVAGPESGGNYNVIYGGGQVPEGLTVGEIRSLQREHGRKTGSSAIGKYQFISKTLDGLLKEEGVSDDELWTPQLQDRLATRLLERRGLSGYLKGDLSKEEFAHNLSKEWAGLPTDESGRSFYHGDKMGNKAGRSWNDLLAAIPGREIDTRMASTDTGGSSVEGELPVSPDEAAIQAELVAENPELFADAIVGQDGKPVTWSAQKGAYVRSSGEVEPYPRLASERQAPARAQPQSLVAPTQPQVTPPAVPTEEDLPWAQRQDNLFGGAPAQRTMARQDEPDTWWRKLFADTERGYMMAPGYGEAQAYERDNRGRAQLAESELSTLARYVPQGYRESREPVGQQSAQQPEQRQSSGGWHPATQAWLQSQTRQKPTLLNSMLAGALGKPQPKAPTLIDAIRVDQAMWELEKTRREMRGQGSGPAAPSGYRWTPEGNLAAIPGGPADKREQAPAPPSGYRWTSDGGLQAIPGGPADKPQTVDQWGEAKNRTEVQDRLFENYSKEAGDYKFAVERYNDVADMEPGKMTGSDQRTLIVSFAKMVLPREAVMSDDQATIQNAGRRMPEIMSYWTAAQGDMLTEQQQKDILRQMDSLAGQRVEKLREIHGRYATQLGQLPGDNDPDVIFGRLPTMREQKWKVREAEAEAERQSAPTTGSASAPPVIPQGSRPPDASRRLPSILPPGTDLGNGFSIAE